MKKKNQSNNDHGEAPPAWCPWLTFNQIEFRSQKIGILPSYPVSYVRLLLKKGLRSNTRVHKNA